MAATGLALPAASGADAERSSHVRNLVLILADDMGWDDLGCQGGTLIKTPHLDALAEAGFRFASFYAHPVCAPTRASLLTGRHYLRTGVSNVHGGRDYLHPGEVTMADIFRASGHATGMWGKWHSGKAPGYLPWERGFDEAYMADLYIHENGGGFLNGKRIETEGWTTDALTAMAQRFIESNREQPFFAFVSYLAPHGPLEAPAELIAQYEAKGIGRAMATVSAMVEQMDAAIGRLLATIRDCGLEEETVVVFLSDNGPQYFGTDRVSPEDYALRYASGLRGHKGSLLENGIRVPMVGRIPEMAPGKVFSQVASVHDLLPTFIEIFGLKAPAEAPLMDGQSLLPRMRNVGEETVTERFFTASNIGWPPVKSGHGLRDWQKLQHEPVGAERPSFEEQLLALRDGDDKLIRSPELEQEFARAGMREMLFDMRNDPTESKDVAGENPVRAKQLREEMRVLYDSIRKEPHAWHTPVFRIRAEPLPEGAAVLKKRENEDFWNLDWSSGGGIVPLNSPAKRLGAAWNADHFLSLVDQPGDGGEYLLYVEEAGDYTVAFRGREFGGDPVPVRVEVENGDTLEAEIPSDNAVLGRLKLPQGNALLRITRREAGGPNGTRWGDLYLFRQP